MSEWKETSDQWPGVPYITTVMYPVCDFLIFHVFLMNQIYISVSVVAQNPHLSVLSNCQVMQIVEKQKLLWVFQRTLMSLIWDETTRNKKGNTKWNYLWPNTHCEVGNYKSTFLASWLESNGYVAGAGICMEGSMHAHHLNSYFFKPLWRHVF